MPKIKRYFILGLNCILPFIIFFLPFYSTSYTDDIEKITISENFYKMFNFNENILFSICMSLFLLLIVVSFVMFIMLLIDNFKLIFYKKITNTIIIIVGSLFLIISIIFFIYSIYLATLSNTEIIIVKNNFCIGALVLLLYEIVQFIYCLFKVKKGKF